ncbi:MAG: hypothetical protein IPK13_00500 [Deltaproteobacteria bacterium]|nr:hypothetical protein [Deltaproteobacteria bacterium]
MAAGKAERAVHRLLDMVVEEVSLVDRAANQHRFLIVKRSEPMDQDTAAVADATETPPNDGHHTEPAPPDTDETVVDLNELPDDDSDEVVETKALDGSPSALILATQALEALTEAVEVLGTVSEEEARARVAELARELHMVATRLGGAMNAGEMPAAAPAADTAPDLGSVIASVRSVLERVGQMIAQPAPDATPVEAKKPEATKTDDTSDAVATKLDSVVTELRAIGETVKAQQQRLARMEKRFGLPNSAPIGERPTRAEDEADVGWPLDLNRSLDRESVDKAISFHDV